MTTRRLRRLGTVVIFAISAMWLGREPIALTGARVHGYLEATRDLARGTPGWRIVGGGWPASFADRLNERCHVRVRDVGGCTVPRSLVVRTVAYDSVILPTLQRRYGDRILETVFSEAQEMDRQRRAQRERVRVSKAVGH